MTATDPPRVVGLDLSLTSTGMAVACGGAVRLRRIQPARLGGHDRIDLVRREIRYTLAAIVADLIVVEGPSFGSPNKQHELGGLWWIVTRMLWREHRPYAVVTPTQLKKYALGKGSGKGTDKDQVLAAVVRRYPMADVDGNDVADALVLAAMGADHLGCPLAPVPQAHRAVLAGVKWPQVRERVT